MSSGKSPPEPTAILSGLTATRLTSPTLPIIGSGTAVVGATPNANVQAGAPMLSGSSDQPHLVSLVLQSKKALQHGEQLCTRAHSASNASAQAAVDVLALDAKVRWVVEAVIEQLKLAASVAKSIKEKRTHIEKQVNEWDTTRTKHADELDGILESLGSQLVPPDFHQTSADSSLFGSQHGSDDDDDNPGAMFTSSPKPNLKSPGSPSSVRLISGGNGYTPGSTSAHTKLSASPVSPSATLRRNNSLRGNGNADPKGKGKQLVGEGKHEDRRCWKTLRDFVADHNVEAALEEMDKDRSRLDEVLGATGDFPERLMRTIKSIHASLPVPEPGDPSALKRTQDVVAEQEHIVTTMASVLENLASHYDNMAGALKDTEAGEAFTDEDLQVMNRDTEELSTIMAELEESLLAIEGYHGQLTKHKDDLQKDLDHLSCVVHDLDELAKIMDDMLVEQDNVDIEAEEQLNVLHRHLTVLDQLHAHYVSYRMAFNKLILEMARRRQYREAAENIVRGMTRQLESMTEEETHVRERFNAEYGSHLPDDLCLCISDPPTKWQVEPLDGTSPEVLPEIDHDIISEARDRVGYSEGLPGAESL